MGGLYDATTLCVRIPLAGMCPSTRMCCACVLACHAAVLHESAFRLCVCVSDILEHRAVPECCSLPKTKCRDPGSNRGPSDLRSDALPTELSRLDQVVTPVLVSGKTSYHGRLSRFGMLVLTKKAVKKKAPCGDRAHDHTLTKRMLYQLS